MNRLFYICCFIISFVSCNTEVEKPKDLISEEVMKDVLKDIYIYKQVKTYRIEDKLPEISEINLTILRSHNVTVDQFKASYDYYIIHDAAYDEMLKDIKLELEAELPKSVRDSLAK